MAETSTSNDPLESRDYDIEGNRNLTGDIHISGSVGGNIIIGGDLTPTPVPPTDDEIDQGNVLSTTPTADASLPRLFSNRTIAFLIICAALVGLCLVGMFSGAILGFPPFSNQTKVAVRISAKADGQAISRARVLMFFEGARLVGSTDSTGVVSFSIPSSNQDTPVSLIIETDAYGIEEIQNIQVPQDGFLNIQLGEKEGQAQIVVLVVDGNLEAVIGATIVLLANGETYSQVTDSNGLAKFTANFPADIIDAQIRVGAEGFETDAQRITLQPNTTVGIQLDPTTKSLREINIFAQ